VELLEPLVLLAHREPPVAQALTALQVPRAQVQVHLLNLMHPGTQYLTPLIQDTLRLTQDIQTLLLVALLTVDKQEEVIAITTMLPTIFTLIPIT
jgi:hypothetical protein